MGPNLGPMILYVMAKGSCNLASRTFCFKGGGALRGKKIIIILVSDQYTCVSELNKGGSRSGLWTVNEHGVSTHESLNEREVPTHESNLEVLASNPEVDKEENLHKCHVLSLINLHVFPSAIGDTFAE